MKMKLDVFLDSIEDETGAELMNVLKRFNKGYKIRNWVYGILIGLLIVVVSWLVFRPTEKTVASPKMKQELHLIPIKKEVWECYLINKDTIKVNYIGKNAKYR